MSRDSVLNRLFGLKCPDCRQPISDNDAFCPHCGATLDEPIVQDAETSVGSFEEIPVKSKPSAPDEMPVEKSTSETKKCLYCAETIKVEAVVCRYCGRDLLASNSGSASQSDSPATPPMPSGSPNTPEYIFYMEKRIMILEEELRRLSHALNQAITLSNSKFDKINNDFDEIPNSAIVSPSFLSRAFAVWGHFFVAQLIIAIPIYVIIFLIGAANISH